MVIEKAYSLSHSLQTINYTPTETAVNKIGITGYLEQFASTSDLATFVKSFLPQATNATFTLTEINGGLNTQNDPGVEANLDVQYATGMSWPTPMIFYRCVCFTGAIQEQTGD